MSWKNFGKPGPNGSIDSKAWTSSRELNYLRLLTKYGSLDSELKKVAGLILAPISLTKSIGYRFKTRSSSAERDFILILNIDY
jgi:hypothetical protein